MYRALLWGAWSCWAGVQEFLFLALLFEFVRCFRIEIFHLSLFVPGKPRQVPDEAYQLPGIHVPIAWLAERGHTSETYTIINRIVNFAVGLGLGCGLPHVGRWRVHGSAQHGISAPVVGVAGGAVIGPVRLGFRQDCI